MKSIVAHIESNGAGWYSVYCNEEFPFGVFGEGATIDDAQKNFIDVFDGMRANHKKRTGEDVQATFTFVMDMSAILQECKKFISIAYLAEVTGISKVMLSQYACGTRKPRKEQRERIIQGIHAIGNSCLQIM